MVASPLKTEWAELGWRQEDGDVSFRREGVEVPPGLFSYPFLLRYNLHTVNSHFLVRGCAI